MSVAERGELREGLKEHNGIVVRRSQAILMSADEKQAIADRLGWNRESIRQVIHAFNEHGTACLYPLSSVRPDDQHAFKDEAREH